VAAEHLLWALLEHGAAWRVKLPPPCRDELRAFVAQGLDRLPALNAYRDAAVPALAKEVVDALRPSRWSLFEKPLPAKDLMLRIALVPRIRDWLAWATMDDLLVDDAVAEASSLAEQRGHLTVKVDHFLRVLAEQHWLGAPASLARVLDERLVPAGAPVSEPSLGEDLAVLVAKSKVYARMGRRAATSDMLLCIALREDAVQVVLEEAGIDAEVLLQRLAHGDADLPVPPESGMVEVIFHNDDFTPIELMKELMERKFRLEPGESKHAIATAQDEGEAIVATLPAEEGFVLAHEVRVRAREMRLPLRVTVRGATSARA
jgi:ATP-dependent Clp protease adapter protein ClpS